MPYLNFDLPDYPCQEDMWDKLGKDSRPVVVYGMGNGADKLINRLTKYGVEISDFFASDGFIRGHSFHGKRVKSLKEIKETYTDFVILLSFASNRDEVLDTLNEIDQRFEMYIPDMPVAGEEYFDKEYFNTHYSEITEAYNRLSDAISRNCFAAMINYKLTGEMKYLKGAYSSPNEIYDLLSFKSIVTSIDAGAYNGDTVRELKAYTTALKKVYALEPDRRNYNKLLKYSAAESEIDIIPINAAAWSDDKNGVFNDSGNRNSSISSTVSHEHREINVKLIKIDSLTEEPIDYIKYDVEGAEMDALLGSENTILTNRPALLVSLYHRSKDIYEIINYISEKYSFYSMYLRRLKCVPAWELNLILIPHQ